MLEKFVYRKLLDLHALSADCEDPQVWSRLQFCCAHHASPSAYSNAHKLACGVDFFVSCLCVEIVCLCVRCSAVLCARSSEGVVNSRVSLPIRMISGSIFNCQCRHVDAGSKVPDWCACER